MMNASFTKCIIEVIHTHLSIIGICYIYIYIYIYIVAQYYVYSLFITHYNSITYRREEDHKEPVYSINLIS